ncbi:MAG: ABC transporter substrate-binding protein, partial [Alphaproteobacteria bacterium]
MTHKILVAAITATAMAAVPVAVTPAIADNHKTVKVGYMQGFAGGRGIFGRYGFEGFELAIEHLGGKLGGMDVEVIKKDTQHKPD